MINFATLEAVRYGPELLPSCEYVSPTTGNEAEVLNLTRLPNNMLVRLKDVGAFRSVDAELRFKADSEVFQVPAAAIPNLRATDVLGYEPTQYDLLASHSARLAIYAIADLTNYQVWHGLWVWKQTIADKLALGIPLTPEEKSIDEDLHISQTVQRGTLPAKIDRFLLYEYYPIYRETRALKKDIPEAGIVVDTLTPRKYGKEFVVLEKVSCERPGAATDNVRFTIWRDNDGSPASPLITLHTYAMHLDYDIPCFIPAIREIGLRLEAGTPQEDYCCRYTYTIYKMTNILRARWFGEGPEELIKKVRSGVA